MTTAKHTPGPWGGARRMSKPMEVHVDLEPDQTDALRQIMQLATEAAAVGQLGVVLAQVFTDTMKVTFIEHEYASEIQAILKRRLQDRRTKGTE
jgi:hypothetical protein